VADIVVDGKVKVALVDTIADISAPTVGELAAGTDITDQLTADGLIGFNPDQASVDTTSLASRDNTARGGRRTYQPRLRFKKQSPVDTIYDTYVQGTDTHVVIRRDGSDWEDAFAAGDDVEVYPVEIGEVHDADPEPNTNQRFELPCFLRATANKRAVVDAAT
jgi:hypothetical protein